MPRKVLYEVLAAVFLFSGLATAYSKEINRYIMLHKNRKTEKIVEPSPLASGYDQTTPVEFQFKQNTSEAMKRRVKMVFPPTEKSEDEEEEQEYTNTDIFGRNNSLFIEESSVLIQELEDETTEAIENQKKAEEIKLAETRKQNIASYAASVEAKIKREKEAALAALNKKEEEEKEPIWVETYGPSEEVEEEYDENSVVLVTDPSGKITIKKPGQKPITLGTASTTAKLASGTPPVATGSKPLPPQPGNKNASQKQNPPAPPSDQNPPQQGQGQGQNPPPPPQ